MSDTATAQTVMQGFDGSNSSLDEGLAQADALYADIVSAETDGFLMQLVGLSDPPFAM
jgi:hypothetical protein